MLSGKNLLRKAIAPVVVSWSVIGSASTAYAINPNLKFLLNGTTLYVDGRGVISQEDVQNALNNVQLSSITEIKFGEEISEVQEGAFDGCGKLEGFEYFNKNLVIRPGGLGSFTWQQWSTNWFFINQGNIVSNEVNSLNC